MQVKPQASVIANEITQLKESILGKADKKLSKTIEFEAGKSNTLVMRTAK